MIVETPVDRYNASVSISRQLCELIDDLAFCDGNKHTECMSMPVAASWPIPHPWCDLDSDE